MTDLFSEPERQADQFGILAIHLLRNCGKLQRAKPLENMMPQAIAQEIASPSSYDHEWLEMLHNLQDGGNGIAFENGPTYRCPMCQWRGGDLHAEGKAGFALRTDEHQIVWSRYCHCQAGQETKAAAAQCDERERFRIERASRRRRGLRSIGGSKDDGDDIPF